MEITNLEAKVLLQIAARLNQKEGYAAFRLAAAQLDGYISRLVAKGRDMADIDGVLGNTETGEPVSRFVAKMN